MINDERTYTIPLRDAYRERPPHQKANTAVKAIKSFLSQHMKVDEAHVNVSNGVNEAVWENGARNPPSKVTVIATPQDTEVLAQTEEEHAATPTPSQTTSETPASEDDTSSDEASDGVEDNEDVEDENEDRSDDEEAS